MTAYPQLRAVVIAHLLAHLLVKLYYVVLLLVFHLHVVVVLIILIPLHGSTVTEIEPGELGLQRTRRQRIIFARSVLFGIFLICIGQRRQLKLALVLHRVVHPQFLQKGLVEALFTRRVVPWWVRHALDAEFFHAKVVYYQVPETHVILEGQIVGCCVVHYNVFGIVSNFRLAILIQHGVM